MVLSVIPAAPYRVPERVAVVEFAPDHEFYGAQVKLRLRLPIGEVFALQRLASEDAQAAFHKFGEQVLLSWNVVDADGNDVPASGDGVMTQATEFLAALMKRWTEETTGAPGPLDGPSSNIASSGPESLPPRELGL